MPATGPVRKWSTVAGTAGVLALGLGLGLGLPPAAGPAGATPSQPSGSYGTLPGPHGTPTTGGTISIAETPGSGPTYIFPITPAADTSAYDRSQFQDLMWRPLWWAPKGAQPAIDYSQSISPKPPAYSNHDTTVTITLSPRWRWSDGSAVTSTDLAFSVDLLKAAVAVSPANVGAYTPGLFPDNVASMSTPNPTTFVLNFTKSYNPNFIQLDLLGGLTPLPAQVWSKTSPTGAIIDFTNPANATAIYTFLDAQSKILSTYGNNPLWQTVDGPYKITTFDPSTDANTLVVNKLYSGPVKPKIATIDNVAFTSTSAEFAQLLSGHLTVGFVDSRHLPQVAKLESEGYTVWGYPDLGFNDVTYNFKDTTGDFVHIISQLYVRQALAHLQNEPAIVSSTSGFDGAARPAYGPFPAVPKTPFTPSAALKDPYPFSIATASQLLSSHGWKVAANGTTTCGRAGTGSGQCGAGIPQGTPLTFNLIYAASPPVIGTQVKALASNAKKVGITIALSSKAFNDVTQNLSDASNPSNDDTWAAADLGGVTDHLYPTTGDLFTTTGSSNRGGFSSTTVDADVTASVGSPKATALKKELSDVMHLQPALFEPSPDLIYAFKKVLAGPSSSFAAASQYQFSPEYWYLVKQ